MSELELVITARSRDLGGFSVRRLLPYATHRMVGPFVFFDHMGPAEFKAGEGMDVRPHPHINLATVTYLFEGAIEHRDSLGSDLVIRPGDINWMTAGHGIVHSERTPDVERAKGGRLEGIQLWVALPTESEEIAPSFKHHAKTTLPEFRSGECEVKLLLGEALGFKSPVEVHSDLFYIDVKIPQGVTFKFEAGGREVAAYVVTGRTRAGGKDLEECSMAVAKKGDDLTITAIDEARVLVLGGSSLGPRFLFWNFVSSSEERLEEAKLEWAPGPLKESSRFQPINGDNGEFIPLPGTVM
jgi:redox-sensitive bicupin YhaK (pirin superfamily)